MGIEKCYYAVCDKCGRAYGTAKDEPSSNCNVEMVYHALTFEAVLRKLITGKWIETHEGWICPECINKKEE